jgi:predicted nucleic acid-binding protein
MILADANVLVDVVENDPNWADWSQRQLEAAAASDELAINAVVYAELSVAYRRIHNLGAMLAAAKILLMQIPRPRLIPRRQSISAVPTCRRRQNRGVGGFLHCAHAMISDATLITRDARRDRVYFPGIMLIAPN